VSFFRTIAYQRQSEHFKGVLLSKSLEIIIVGNFVNHIPTDMAISARYLEERTGPWSRLIAGHVQSRRDWTGVLGPKAVSGHLAGIQEIARLPIKLSRGGRSALILQFQSRPAPVDVARSVSGNRSSGNIPTIYTDYRIAPWMY